MELGNYKIKVTTEAESKKVISLLIQLGYKVDQIDRLGFVCTDNGLIYAESMVHWDSYDGKEITLPQLRDLVVLHRNDVSDATHIGKYCGDFYVTSGGVIYGWNDIDAWEKSSATTMDIIEPINKELISGADALRALADGREVELKANGDMNWYDSTQWTVGELLAFKGVFRLKPRTITLNIEIPAPFEPKQSDWGFIKIYYLDAAQSDGWNANHWTEYFDIDLIQFGAWRTEEEIKQVVLALQGALKNG